MLIRRSAAAAAAAAVLALAVPARAQDADSATAPNGLRPGAWSLSFAPNSNERGEFGAWRMVGERTSVGLTLGFHVSDSDSETTDEGQADREDENTSVQLGSPRGGTWGSRAVSLRTCWAGCRAASLASGAMPRDTASA
jgi:hypothetical protein